MSLHNLILSNAANYVSTKQSNPSSQRTSIVGVEAPNGVNHPVSSGHSSNVNLTYLALNQVEESLRSSTALPSPSNQNNASCGFTECDFEKISAHYDKIG